MELQSPFAGKSPEPPNVPLSQFLLEKVKLSLEKHGDRDLVFDLSTGKKLRYSEVEPLSRNVASGLTRKGFSKQDTLIYMTTNAGQIHAIIFGVMRLNGILRPCYPQDLEETVHSRLQDSECRFVVCDSGTSPVVLSAVKKLNWPVSVYCFDPVEGCTPISELFNDDGSAFPENVSVDLDDTVSLLCTGGTTGPSKGSCATHRNYLHALARGKYTLLPKMTNGKMIFVGRPYHLSGFIIPLCCILQDATGFAMSDPKPDTFLKGIQDHKPSIIGGFISGVLWCITDHGYDLSSVRTVVTGAAPVTASMQVQLKKALPNCQAVHRLYGSTEGLFSIITWDPVSEVEGETLEIPGIPPSSGGILLSFVKLKVHDVDTNEQLGPNKPGMMHFKSPTNFKGYFKKPQATAEALRDGWFNSGDFGYYTEEGHIFILDRFKEVFKFWGNHIAPVEIEEVILRHPDVTEACVIGVPDKEGGAEALPRAYIVKRPGSNLDEEAIKEFVHAEVEPYKQLRGGVKFLDVMPKTNVGKLSRILIMKLFKEGKI